MKTLRLLATLLLVALSMGLYSCSKDDFVDTPPIPVTPITSLMTLIRSSQSTWMIILTLSADMLKQEKELCSYLA